MKQHPNKIREEMSRGTFLKITALGGLALGLGIATRRRLLEDGVLSRVHQTRFLMGTLVNLTIVTAQQERAQQAVAVAFTEMERLIGIFNHREPKAALAQLNRERRLKAAPAELRHVLRLANHIQSMTNGAFDPAVLNLRGTSYTAVHIRGNSVTLAGRDSVTLDGIAKGWIVDRAVDSLRAHDMGHCLVEAGGDLMASSLAEAQPAWQIGLQHPRAEALLNSLALVNRAVATSGDYRNVRDAAYQQHHIIDPHEGHSPEHFASVSVLAPTAAYADGLATALMVMDIDAGQSLVTHLKDIEALWITKEMQQIRSAGFPI